jgi:hypothetical protein
MFFTQILLATSIIIVCVVFHVVSLIYLAKALKFWVNTAYGSFNLGSTVLLVSTATLALIGIHSLEALIWAVVYFWGGEFESIQRALYFSIVTSTTLGFGDITLSPNRQLLSSFEAMGGLILFSLSTAFFLAIMRYIFEILVDQKESKL